MSQQVIKLQVNNGDTVFFDYETYEYGTGKEYKTLRGAVQQATRDFKQEARFALEKRLKNVNEMVSTHIRVIDNDQTVFQEIKIS